MVPDCASTRNDVIIASRACLTNQDNSAGVLQLCFQLNISPQAHNYNWRHCIDFVGGTVVTITGSTIIIITRGIVMKITGGTVITIT